MAAKHVSITDQVKQLKAENRRLRAALKQASTQLRALARRGGLGRRVFAKTPISGRPGATPGLRAWPNRPDPKFIKALNVRIARNRRIA
jgi:hypothetical protein